MEAWLESHCSQFLLHHPSRHSVTLIGAYDARFSFSPTGADLNYVDRVVIAATNRSHGACGCPNGSDEIDTSSIDQFTIEELGRLHPCLDIAICDAFIRAMQTTEHLSTTLTGTIPQKARLRALLIVEAVKKLLPRAGSDQKTEVALIGAVGSIVESLLTTGLSPIVTEMDTTLIGREMCGVQIKDSAKTEHAVESADCAVVTGMTIATRSLGPILAAASRGKTPIVFFAQTGPGILRSLDFPTETIVLAETFPFYMWPGTSSVTTSFHQANLEANVLKWSTK